MGNLSMLSEMCCYFITCLGKRNGIEKWGQRDCVTFGGREDVIVGTIKGHHLSKAKQNKNLIIDCPSLS